MLLDKWSCSQLLSSVNNELYALCCLDLSGIFMHIIGFVFEIYVLLALVRTNPTLFFALRHTDFTNNLWFIRIYDFFRNYYFYIRFWLRCFAESIPLHSLDSEEDIEEEFRELEAELQDEIPPMQVQGPVSHANVEAPNDAVESLIDNLSRVKLEAI